jgi:multimeric flavodoxin WrbA
LTDQLVSRALEGVESANVDAKKVYLTDYDVPCYTEETKSCPEELNVLCGEADALIIGAPVYWGDINGLTKDFMDTVRIRDANGKYALGTAIAGGTGKGLCLAVQSIYSFFYHRQIRGIDPTPVSRFNFEKALGDLEASGRKLAGLCKDKRPFEDLWDRIEHYGDLDYLEDGFLDEILLLGRYLIDISGDNPELSRAKGEHESAQSLIGQGRKKEAVRHAVKAYDLLYF